MEISWDNASRTDWNRLTAEARKCPFEQSWAYGEGIAATGSAVHRAVLSRNEQPLAFAQVFTKRLGRVANVQQLLRGPVFLDPASADEDFFGSLELLAERPAEGPRTLQFWTPELGPAAAPVLKRLGWRRVMSGYHTAWLGLDPAPALLRAARRYRYQGIARFKLGLGGEVVTLAGTYF